jgi:hypothetical protein
MNKLHTVIRCHLQSINRHKNHARAEKVALWCQVTILRFHFGNFNVNQPGPLSCSTLTEWLTKKKKTNNQETKICLGMNAVTAEVM